MKTRTIFTAAILFAMGIASTATGNTAMRPPLKVTTVGNVSYVSGGVGADERKRLLAMSHGDNLQLSFALQDGDYLGGAEVNIKDHSGKEILEAAANGPLFFAKLPAGKYIVQATTMGHTLTRAVNIPGKGQTPIYFTWKDNEQRQALRLAS